MLFWRVRCHFSEGRDLLAAAVTQSNGAPSALQAKALWGAGFLAFMAGDLDEAIPRLEESLGRSRELGDLQAQARALLILGNAAQYREGVDALSLLQESAALARQAGDSWCLAHALGVAGFEHCRRDDLSGARSLLEECLATAREARDNQSLRMGLLGVGSVTARQGDYRSAEPLLAEGLEITGELGEDYGRAIALTYLGQVATGQGQYGEAAQSLEAALALLRGAGSPLELVAALRARALVARLDADYGRAHHLLDEAAGVARSSLNHAMLVLLGRGELAAEEGDLDAAGRLLEDALAQARTVGDTSATATALYRLGELARLGSDAKRAAALHDEALALHRQIGDAQATVASLDAVARLAAMTGRSQHAARLLGATQALRDANGYARFPEEQAGYQADLSVVRDSLSSEDFERAFSHGAHMSIEEAVMLASKGRGPQRRSSSGWSSLTDAEEQLAALVAEGLTNPEIAERLFVSLATVKSHLSHIFSKLGVSGRMELAAELRRRAEPGTVRSDR